jgi:pimeloyl-ACP methyl ester carboxylesterase
MNYPIDKISFVSEGSGEPPVLFLHGWGGNEDTLATLSAPLTPHRRTLRLALPGFGSSPEPEESWSSNDYVEVLACWLDSQSLTRIDLIGHSFGGKIAVGLAASRPELVNRLVLIASAGLRPNRSFAVRAKVLYAKALRKTAGLVGGRLAKRLEIRWRKLGSEDWKAASPVKRGTLSRVIPEDMAESLKRVVAPTLLIWGTLDTATPIWMGRRMAELIPDVHLLALEGTGHYCFLERKGEVAAAIWKHLELPEAW